MAAVVVTTTVNRTTVWGDRKVVFADLAFDTGDYAADGVPITPAQFGLNTVIDECIVTQAFEVSATPTANVGMFNPDDVAIRFFQSAGDGDALDEKPAEAFGSGAGCRVIVIGY